MEKPLHYSHKEEIASACKKSGKFDNEGIEGLAEDKPVVYKIEDNQGKDLYVGVAQRGRVEARLKEHLPGGADPVPGGAKVRIQQKVSIADAEKTEARIIKNSQPPQNKKGK